MQRHLPKIMASLCIVFATGSYANGDCTSYPYSEGMNIELMEDGTKILATGSASVSFDDVDSIKDARTEAEMEAKALIAKFLSEGIQSDTQINKVVQESKITTAEGRKADRQELVKRIQSLRNSSQALLRGVVPLGSCYTKAREVRVSIGIKPETVRAAGSLAGSISSSMARNPSPSAIGSNTGGSGNSQQSAPSTNSATEQHRGMNGWSDSERARKF